MFYVGLLGKQNHDASQLSHGSETHVCWLLTPMVRYAVSASMHRRRGEVAMGKRTVVKRDLGEIPMLTMDDASVSGLLDEISANLGTNSDIFGLPKHSKGRLKPVVDIASPTKSDCL